MISRKTTISMLAFRDGGRVKLVLFATIIMSLVPAFAQMGSDCNLASGGCGGSSPSNSANLNGDSAESLMPGFGGFASAATFSPQTISGVGFTQASLGSGAGFMNSINGMDASTTLTPGLAPATPPASDESDYRQ